MTDILAAKRPRERAWLKINLPIPTSSPPFPFLPDPLLFLPSPRRDSI